MTNHLTGGPSVPLLPRVLLLRAQVESRVIKYYNKSSQRYTRYSTLRRWRSRWRWVALSSRSPVRPQRRAGPLPSPAHPQRPSRSGRPCNNGAAARARACRRRCRRSPCTCCAAARARRCRCRAHSPCIGRVAARAARRGCCRRTPCTTCAPARACRCARACTSSFP